MACGDGGEQCGGRRRTGSGENGEAVPGKRRERWRSTPMRALSTATCSDELDGDGIDGDELVGADAFGHGG